MPVDMNLNDNIVTTDDVTEGVVGILLVSATHRCSQLRRKINLLFVTRRLSLMDKLVASYCYLLMERLGEALSQDIG